VFKYVGFLMAYPVLPLLISEAIEAMQDSRIPWTPVLVSDVNKGRVIKASLSPKLARFFELEGMPRPIRINMVCEREEPYCSLMLADQDISSAAAYVNVKDGTPQSDDNVKFEGP
jgi:hypothetical protein